MYPTSVRLTAEAKAALNFLRTQMGGFNLNKAVSTFLTTLAKERGWLGILLLVILSGCGDPAMTPRPDFSLDGAVVISQGKIEIQPAEYQQAYADVKACVVQNHSGQVRSDSPTIAFVSKPFTCEGKPMEAGCYEPSTDTIYLLDDIFHDGQDWYQLLAHELIHWFAPEAAHGSQLFNVCEYTPWRDKWRTP